MAKTQSARFEIEKFNGKNNFEIWKVKMHDFLVQHVVAKALLGKSKQPYNITDKTTTIGLWTKLEKLYMTKSLTNRILLKRQLYGLRMKEDTSIADHLNAFNTLLVQLQSIEVKVPSEDKAITLLCSLPESWDHFVTSISLSSSETIEFDGVIASLLSEEIRRRSHSETSTSEAMMVRGRSKERRPRKLSDSRSKSKGKKSKLKCWFCGRSGHLKKDCRKRQQQASKAGSSTEKKEANTTDTGSTSGSGILLVMKAKKGGNLFQLEGGTGSDFVSTVSEHDNSYIHLWHQRLGHMSERGLKILVDRKLLLNLKSRKLDFCKHCLFGKQSKQKFKTGKHTSKGILDYIHSDVWGPAPTTSYGGSSYFVSFIDDFSRKLLQGCRIERHKTTVYTPQQNGVAERMNMTLLESARSMLSNAGLQKELWMEAVETTCYVIKRSPSTAIDCKIPQEVWKGHPCHHSKLRVFGCDAYALVPKHQRTKLDPKSKRDVKFNESSLVQLDVDSRLKQDDVSDFQHIQFDSISNDIHDDHSSDTSHEQVSESEHEQGSGLDHEQVSDTDRQEVPTDGSHPIEEVPETSLRRSTRIKRPPRRYDDYVTSIAFTPNDNEPLSYQEAIEGSKSDKWKAAMKDEMMALIKNGTWDLVELPKGRKIVGCKWVFKLKRGVDDTEDKYKARLVAKGFSQKAGIDFHEIFSPMVKIVSIRIVLALVALLDLELQQLDVKTALLHGDSDEEIYVEQLEGFVHHRKEKFVCRLKKSLYGA
eukprot:PITA_33691